MEIALSVIYFSCRDCSDFLSCTGTLRKDGAWSLDHSVGIEVKGGKAYHVPCGGRLEYRFSEPYIPEERRNDWLAELTSVPWGKRGLKEGE